MSPAPSKSSAVGSKKSASASKPAKPAKAAAAASAKPRRSRSGDTAGSRSAPAIARHVVKEAVAAAQARELAALKDIVAKGGAEALASSVKAIVAGSSADDAAPVAR